MTGKDVIKYIQENNLEEALIMITATMYYSGDHDCRSTDDVSIYTSTKYVGNNKYVPTINFYVDSELY